LTVKIVKNGYTLIIEGTSTEIVNALVAEGYPKPVASTYDTSSGKYYVIAYRLQ